MMKLKSILKQAIDRRLGNFEKVCVWARVVGRTAWAGARTSDRAGDERRARERVHRQIASQEKGEDEGSRQEDKTKQQQSC